MLKKTVKNALAPMQGCAKWYASGVLLRLNLAFCGFNGSHCW